MKKLFLVIARRRNAGIAAALSSAVFLGVLPVFGRWAILNGFSPLAVVTLRTCMASAILFIIMAVFRPRFLYIFPVGLIGCLLAGVINGLGSLLYYMALGDLPASLGQLLYAIYPLLVALFSVLDRQPLSRLTVLRILLAAAAILLLTIGNGGLHAPLHAILMMLGAAALYALHIPINQRVLYEIPAPTVTVYTLLAMSLVTLPFYLMFDRQWPAANVSWWSVISLTIMTFISRLTLFMGVKHIGAIQTAILGLGELFITIVLSYYFLNEQLTTIQILGAIILAISLLMIALEKHDQNKKHPKGGWLAWIHPPEVSVTWGLHE